MRKLFDFTAFISCIWFVFVFLAIALTLTGCGKTQPGASSSQVAACAGMPALGTWYSTTLPKTLVLSEQCNGATTYCNEKFSFIRLNTEGTSILVSVTQTNGGPECLSLGAHTCTASMPNANTLQLNCGTPADYTR